MQGQVGPLATSKGDNLGLIFGLDSHEIRVGLDR